MKFEVVRVKIVAVRPEISCSYDIIDWTYDILSADSDASRGCFKAPNGRSRHCLFSFNNTLDTNNEC